MNKIRANGGIWWALAVLLANCAGGGAVAQAPDGGEGELRRVTVSAEGYSKDDALQQALRKALEKGAGAEISSHSQVRDFVLVRDTIYSRASGIVTDYRVTDGPKEVAGGFWEITIEATVRPDAVARAWGEVQNLLDQLGRPKIMVWIDERIDGELQDDSIVESGIEKLFLEAGFDLVDREAVASIKRREMEAARKDDNPEKLNRLAKDAGAHVLIRGGAAADRAGIRRIYRQVPAAFYNCSVQAKIYYTDTGKLLASEAIPTRERGVRSSKEYSPQAARAALKAATWPSERRREEGLATNLYETVMRSWSTELTAGGDITLEVDPLAFKAYVELKRALEGLENVREVDGDFSSGSAVFRIKATLTAETLAEKLIEKPFAQWLEVQDLKPNRIQTRGKQGG